MVVSTCPVKHKAGTFLIVILQHFLLGADGEDVGQDLRGLLCDERQGPGEDVHEVWQPVRVRAAVELAYVHHIVLKLDNGSLQKLQSKTQFP